MVRFYKLLEFVFEYMSKLVSFECINDLVQDDLKKLCRKIIPLLIVHFSTLFAIFISLKSYYGGHGEVYLYLSILIYVTYIYRNHINIPIDIRILITRGQQ